MDLPFQMTYRHLAPSDALTAHAQDRADKLPAFHRGITSCRVAIESPHRHRHNGRHLRVRVALTVAGAGAALVVDHDAGRDAEDAYAAVDEAFHTAERVLVDHAARLREGVHRAPRSLRQP